MKPRGGKKGSVPDSPGRKESNKVQALRAQFSNKYITDELQEEDKNFRDSIYNFNRLGGKANVRCKFFDGIHEEGPGLTLVVEPRHGLLDSRIGTGDSSCDSYNPGFVPGLPRKELALASTARFGALGRRLKFQNLDHASAAVQQLKLEKDGLMRYT